MAAQALLLSSSHNGARFGRRALVQLQTPRLELSRSHPRAARVELTFDQWDTHRQARGALCPTLICPTLSSPRLVRNLQVLFPGCRLPCGHVSETTLLYFVVVIALCENIADDLDDPVGSLGCYHAGCCGNLTKDKTPACAGCLAICNGWSAGVTSDPSDPTGPGVRTCPSKLAGHKCV
eukprot:COSAG02_NODE_3025_length_7518_cov_30.632565_3_plen_179_part_00